MCFYCCSVVLAFEEGIWVQALYLRQKHRQRTSKRDPQAILFQAVELTQTITLNLAMIQLRAIALSQGVALVIPVQATILSQTTALSRAVVLKQAVVLK